MHTSSLVSSAGRSCQARSQPHKPAATTKSAPLRRTVTEEEPSSRGVAATIVVEPVAATRVTTHHGAVPCLFAY